MKVSEVIFKDGEFKIKNVTEKINFFTARGIIKEVSDGCKSFRLFVSPEGVKGLHVSKKGALLNVEVLFDDSIMLRSWFHVGDEVHLKLLYKFIRRGDEQISKIIYKEIHEVIETEPPELVQGSLF